MHKKCVARLLPGLGRYGKAYFLIHPVMAEKPTGYQVAARLKEVAGLFHHQVTGLNSFKPLVLIPPDFLWFSLVIC
jgi:hypothetical protein